MEEIELGGNEESIAELVLSIGGTSEYMDIGIIEDDRSSGNRVVRFKPKDGKGNIRNLDKNNPLKLPYCYPLIWSQGEDGYNKESGINMPAYISSIMFRCEINFKLKSLLFPNEVYANITTNRLQAFARLGQVVVVDLVSQMIDTRLDWIMKHQDEIIGHIDQIERDQLNDNDYNDYDNINANAAEKQKK
jgi:hypothetical protein